MKEYFILPISAELYYLMQFSIVPRKALLGGVGFLPPVEIYSRCMLIPGNVRNELNQDYNLDIRGLLNKFPDFFRIGTFIDSTHMKL